MNGSQQNTTGRDGSSHAPGTPDAAPHRHGRLEGHRLLDRLFGETKRAYGRLDVLVNNACIYGFVPIEEVTEELYRKHFDVNVLSVLRATKTALKHFGPAGGSIVNVSSIASTSAPASSSVYSATKAAVDTITRSLAKELGPRKIRGNAVNPGIIETEACTRRCGVGDGRDLGYRGRRALSRAAVVAVSSTVTVTGSITTPCSRRA
jgi:NAD(P)-dependent dehydrogenase (short-subunit alcohol dehydrogenase family)